MTPDLEGARVLVIGVSGFIGSHLVRRLLDERAQVYALVRKSPVLGRFKEKKEKIIPIQVDLRDFLKVKKVIREIEPHKVFHLAAYVDVSRSFDMIEEVIDINVKGTINLLKALEGIDYDSFINTGSSEEYGDNPAPFREDQAPNPVSPYSASKASTTLFCRMLYKSMGLPIVTLRPFPTYGPGQESNMLIPELIRSIMQDRALKMTSGEQTRDFIYVEDVIEGYIKASVCSKARGEIINIGSGREYKIKDVANLIVRLMSASITPEMGALPYRPGEAWHFYCDNSKAKAILGWEPRVELEEGLQRTIDWHKERAA